MPNDALEQRLLVSAVQEVTEGLAAIRVLMAWVTAGFSVTALVSLYGGLKVPSRWTKIGLDLSDEDLELIIRASESTGETVSEFVNRALVEFLDREDPYWRHRAVQGL